MTRFETLVETVAALQTADLEQWIADELVAPERHAGTYVFAEAECARVRLLATLRYDLEVEPESLPVVLSLVDQLYDARANLRALSSAVAAQPDEVRARILAAVEVETVPE